MKTFAAGWILDLFAVLFLYAGVLKALTLRRFRHQLGAFGVKPAALAAAGAVALPAVELSLAAACLLRWRPDRVLPALLAFLGLLTLFVVRLLRSGQAVSCFCFGEDEGPVSSATLARNGALILLAGLGWALIPSGGVPADWTYPRLLGAGYAFCAVLLFLTGFRLLEIRRALREAV